MSIPLVSLDAMHFCACTKVVCNKNSMMRLVSLLHVPVFHTESRSLELHAWEPKILGRGANTRYIVEFIFLEGGGNLGLGVGNPRGPHPLYETLRTDAYTMCM